MERKINAALLIGFCLLFFACERKETPVPAYDRGNAITAVAEMGPDYKYQVWFRLDDHQVVALNLKTAWDLAFECSSTGAHVLLNTSKSMRAYKTSFTDLSDVHDTAGLGIHGSCDDPGGNPDSTAIGDWQSSNTVYIINRGYNELAQQQGYYKLKIISVGAAEFTIAYADLYSSAGVVTATVLKDPDRTYAAYSLGTHAQVAAAPARTDYDLCFTQYTHIFYDPFQYYLVTGVLINPYNTQVAGITGKAFSAITLADTAGHTFSAAQNAIGYDWKTYTISTNEYTVDVNKCYIIRDSRGFYYKLHFIDFYNDSGVKGYPKFEYRKL